MKKIILILFVSILSAKNPIVYAALGDVIYDNVGKIAKLKQINKYEPELKKINKYVDDVRITKEQGFAIVRAKSNIDKKQYLEKLRIFSKTNDYFIRRANESFLSAIENQDNVLFVKILESGLIDIETNKNKIIEYYVSHSQTMNKSATIQTCLDDNVKLNREKKEQQRRNKTKKTVEEKKIKRIRQRDKEKQAALEKKLDDEVKSKKLEIRNQQKSELFH